MSIPILHSGQLITAYLSRLVRHFRIYDRLFISSITEFEIINGATPEHMQFWNLMLSRFIILDFDSRAARKAAEIIRQLKTKRKSIDKPDLLIAATAVVHGRTLDTGNRKHFIHIETPDLLPE